MPAVSAKQRFAMAIAEHHPEKLYDKDKGMLKMSHGQLHDFASTKGLPKMHKGGIVPAAGPYSMKGGELVLPKNLTSKLHKVMYAVQMAGKFGKSAHDSTPMQGHSGMKTGAY